MRKNLHYAPAHSGGSIVWQRFSAMHDPAHACNRRDVRGGGADPLSSPALRGVGEGAGSAVPVVGFDVEVRSC